MDILLVLIAALVVVVAIPALVMWALGRFWSRKAAAAVGVGGILYMAFSAVSTVVDCQRDTGMFHSDGGPVAACDGPGGAISYGYAYLVAPLVVLVLLLLTCRQFVGFSKKDG